MNLPTKDKTWHMVVDFCVFIRRDIKLVYRALKQQIGLYVYISSDSVYEVCDERVRDWYIQRQQKKHSVILPEDLKSRQDTVEVKGKTIGKDLNDWDWGDNIKQFKKYKKDKPIKPGKGRVLKIKKRGKNADTDAFDSNQNKKKQSKNAVTEKQTQNIDPMNWGILPENVRSDIDPNERPLFDPDNFLHTKVKEDEAIRPPTESEIFYKAALDAYGHNKLRAEEYLNSHCYNRNESFAYVNLRLPDVLGPYDGTVRYWAYLKWFKNMEWWPVHFENIHAVRPLSFVASEDVAALIVTFLDKIEVIKTDIDNSKMDKGKFEGGSRVYDSINGKQIVCQKFEIERNQQARYNGDFLGKVHGKSYNLAFEETPTLIEFIEQMVKKYSFSNIVF